MSTKIYEAYRTKVGVDIWSILPSLRAQAEAGAKTCLRALYEVVTADVDTTTERYQKALTSSKDDRLARLTVAADVIGREYKAQASSSLRNPFNLDVALAIRHHEGRSYIIPHTDYTMSKALVFLGEHPALEEYAYWNSTDRDDDVSEEEWNKRGSTWDAMATNWQDVLTLHVVEPAMFYMVDAGMDMMRERMAEMKAAAT